jgi:DNA ligase-1
MESPAKRRKKNDHKSSPQTIGSLEYFFDKQRQEANNKGNAAARVAGIENGLKADQSPNAEAKLTDEQLARELQEQWNKEDTRAADIDPGRRDETIPRGSCPNGSNGDPKTSREEPDAEDLAASGATQSRNEDPTDISNDKVTKTLSLQSTGTAEDKVSATLPLDESPLKFNPSYYIPDLQKSWRADGGDSSYALLTRCFVLVNATQSRLKIVDIMVNLIRTIIEADPASLLPAVSTLNVIKPRTFANGVLDRSGSQRMQYPLPIFH